MEKLVLLFPERLAEARRLKKLSLKDLAQKAGMTYNALSSYEKGDKIPNLMFATKISHALDVPVSWLFAYRVSTETEENGTTKMPWEV